MNFKLTKEVEFKNNDIYILESLASLTLINDNYEGIILLDQNLEIIKKIKTFEGMIIYSIYKNIYNNEILLYCPDNDRIVHIDLEDEKTSIFNLGINLKKIVFSNIYYWDKEEILLTDFEGNFYKVDKKQNKINKISKALIKKNNFSFYELCEKANTYSVITFNDREIVYNLTENQVGIFNHKNGSLKIINIPDKLIHDIAHDEDKVAFSSNTELYVYLNDATEKVQIKIQQPFTLRTSKFLKTREGGLVSLLSNNSDANNCKLILTQWY